MPYALPQYIQNVSPYCVCTGIEPHGNKVLQPAVFTVDTLEAGSGEVLVYVEDPEGHKEEASYLSVQLASQLT